MEIDIGSIRSHYMTNTLWKALVTCLKKVYGMSEYVNPYPANVENRVNS
jgi:hypothetical protein